MREHEYRAWDKRTKQMVEVVAIVYSDFQIEDGCDDNLGDSVIDAGVWIKVCLEVVHRDFKDVELMQYTGLKDKNVERICESDFVKWEIQRGTFIVSEVIFTRGKFCVVSGGLVWGCGNSCSKDGKLGDVEKIGNIYENPELKEADQ